MKLRRRTAHRSFDLRSLGAGEWIVGIDEAGRGALAGPVCAGAVVLHRSFYDTAWCRRTGRKVDDSKKLEPALREELLARIEALAHEGGAWFAAGWGSVEEIAVYNILGATRLAMQRAMEAAAAPVADRMALPLHCYAPDELFGVPALPGALVLVDGKPLHPFPYAHEAVVKGDARSLVIGMASIVAKVSRDRLMALLAAAHPEYGFAGHKGYATPQHCEALRANGPCRHHRPLFLRKILAHETLVDEQVDLELLESDA